MNPIAKPLPSLVALLALSRKKVFAAGASPQKRSAKSARFLRHRGSSGLSVLRGERPGCRLEGTKWKACTLALLPSGHKAKIQSRASSRGPTHSHNPKCKVKSGVGHAARAARVGMLRHSNGNTNTKQGCGSPSAV